MGIVTRYSDNALPNAAERDLRWMKKEAVAACVAQREGRSITSFATVSAVDYLQELRCLFVREE